MQIQDKVGKKIEKKLITVTEAMVKENLNIFDHPEFPNKEIVLDEGEQFYLLDDESIELITEDNKPEEKQEESVTIDVLNLKPKFLKDYQEKKTKKNEDDDEEDESEESEENENENDDENGEGEEEKKDDEKDLNEEEDPEDEDSEEKKEEDDEDDSEVEIEEDKLPPALVKFQKLQGDKVLDYEQVKNHYVVASKKQSNLTAIINSEGKQIHDVDTWEDAKSWITRNIKESTQQSEDKEEIKEEDEKDKEEEYPYDMEEMKNLYNKYKEEMDDDDEDGIYGAMAKDMEIDEAECKKAYNDMMKKEKKKESYNRKISKKIRKSYIEGVGSQIKFTTTKNHGYVVKLEPINSNSKILNMYDSKGGYHLGTVDIDKGTFEVGGALIDALQGK